MLPNLVPAAVVAAVPVLETPFARTEAMNIFEGLLPVQRRAAKVGSPTSGRLFTDDLPSLALLTRQCEGAK
jgi:hypothetical protein